MARRNSCGDVRVAVCGGQTRLGMFGNGIVSDIVLYCQSDIFRHPWIPLRQGYSSNVEPASGIIHRFSCRNVAILRHQGSMVYHICRCLFDYRMDGNGNKQIYEKHMNNGISQHMLRFIVTNGGKFAS